MTNRTLATLALLLVPFGAPFGAPATPVGVTDPPEPGQESDLEALVQAEAARAGERTVEEVWERARALRDAESLGADGELDRVLDRLLGRTEELSPQAMLLYTATRLDGDDPDPLALAEALEPLLASSREDLQRAAAALFGERIFKRLNLTHRNELVEKLQAAAEDEGRSPEYRLDMAMAAYKLGGGSARQEAYAVMHSFLDSQDAELRAQGALALASATESELTGKLRSVLETLAMAPNDRGRLAKAYLQLEKDRDYSERKVRDLRAKLNEQSVPEEYEELLAVQDLIGKMHLEGNRVDPEELVGAAVDGMLRWMDPHSAYFSSPVYSKFMQDLEAEYGGIGAYVRNDRDSGLFTIVRPIYSGPAYEAGLQTDDKIVKIGDWPTLGQPEDEIIKRLKGKPGTSVDLYVWRRGMDLEQIERPTADMKVTVEREQIEIPAGSHQLLPGGIGLIELTAFNRRSQEQLETWIRADIRDGMKALILDMRRNSGGLLTEARDVTDVFLPKDKVVVKTESRGEDTDIHWTRHDALVPEDMPIVILTSSMTASAAEIVSGALKDHDRATLVGKRTFGKGSVQQLLPILLQRQDRWDDENDNWRWDPGEVITTDHNGNGEVDYAPRVKLTIARYLLPSGRSIHRELDREGELISLGGVEPDVEVDLPLIERWRFEERERVRKSDALKDYVAGHYESTRELFHRLAVNDLKDPSLYPDFDDLMVALETTLGRDDVRDVLRGAIRRKVQDDLGQEFPFGDYVEDVQVQKAIEIALDQLRVDVDDVTEYGLVFDEPAEEDHRDHTLLAASPTTSRMRELLEGAQAAGSVLTEKDVEELLLLVGRLEEGEEN